MGWTSVTLEMGVGNQRACSVGLYGSQRDERCSGSYTLLDMKICKSGVLSSVKGRSIWVIYRALGKKKVRGRLLVLLPLGEAGWSYSDLDRLGWNRNLLG